MPQRRAGLIQLQTNGEMQDAKGSFEYNLGGPKRDAIVGADGIHGFKETVQVPFISGKITDRGTLDVKKLVSLEDATITLSLNGGNKVIVLSEAWFAGEGTVSTEEAEIDVRWEGTSAEEIT